MKIYVMDRSLNQKEGMKEGRKEGERLVDFFIGEKWKRDLQFYGL